MPENETLKRMREDAKEGKAPSTQAGEFIREEMDHIREGKHGARSAKQAIAIGLSKARRAGVKLPAPKGGKTPEKSRTQAARDSNRARKSPGGEGYRRKDHGPPPPLYNGKVETLRLPPLFPVMHAPARGNAEQRISAGPLKKPRGQGRESITPRSVDAEIFCNLSESQGSVCVSEEVIHRGADHACHGHRLWKKVRRIRNHATARCAYRRRAAAGKLDVLDPR